MVKKSEERSRPLATIQYSWPRKEKKNFRRIIAKVEQVEKFLQFAIVQYTINLSSDEAKMLFATPEEIVVALHYPE